MERRRQALLASVKGRPLVRQVQVQVPAQEQGKAQERERAQASAPAPDRRGCTG
jgi:hypothetical protein